MSDKATALKLLDHASDSVRHQDYAASLSFLIRAVEIWVKDDEKEAK